VVDVLRDPLADPLNRRYRPFGEWAQDQLRQPNLFYNRTGVATGTAADPDRRQRQSGQWCRALPVRHDSGSPGDGDPGRRARERGVQHRRPHGRDV
jgi:hypothetical protein